MPASFRLKSSHEPIPRAVYEIIDGAQRVTPNLSFIALRAMLVLDAAHGENLAEAVQGHA